MLCFNLWCKGLLECRVHTCFLLRQFVCGDIKLFFHAGSSTSTQGGTIPYPVLASSFEHEVALSSKDDPDERLPKEMSCMVDDCSRCSRMLGLELVLKTCLLVPDLPSREICATTSFEGI